MVAHHSIAITDFLNGGHWWDIEKSINAVWAIRAMDSKARLLVVKWINQSSQQARDNKIQS